MHMSRSVTECRKPFEVICDNDLLDSCEELWDIFNCNEGYDYSHPAIKRYRIRIVRKADLTQNGYLCRFEELPWKPQTDAAEQFKVIIYIMNKSESEQTPKSVGQEELNMMGPLRVQSSSAASKDEVIALTPMVNEVANENNFVSSVASDTDSTSSETSRSSASEQSSSDSVHATEEPTDAAAFLDLDYLTVLNTIQELDRKTTIPDQDIYSHGNETKHIYTRILTAMKNVSKVDHIVFQEIPF